ncbi:MAG: glycogen/starch/alpha-glucan phosphorylase, partial [SAR324 cluster bacterium]|nr:glycogen/starch/alpha-glucan phosphorylase [SAR324 cluster bacterium]
MDKKHPKKRTSRSERIGQLKKDFKRHMTLTVAHNLNNSSPLDHYTALAHTVRDRIIARWVSTQETYYQENPKRIYYFSLEFLMGRTLGNAVLNLDLTEEIKEALSELGYTLEDLAEIEWDAGLGNGGLGRLAACFLDSMASLDLPAYGFGIRYEYGMFKQAINKLQQAEFPDNWLRYGNPWEFRRAQDIELVQFYGRTHKYSDKEGEWHSEWVDT